MGTKEWIEERKLEDGKKERREWKDREERT